MVHTFKGGQKSPGIVRGLTRASRNSHKPFILASSTVVYLKISLAVSFIIVSHLDSASLDMTEKTKASLSSEP